MRHVLYNALCSPFMLSATFFALVQFIADEGVGLSQDFKIINII